MFVLIRAFCDDAQFFWGVNWEQNLHGLAKSNGHSARQCLTSITVALHAFALHTWRIFEASDLSSKSPSLQLNNCAHGRIDDGRLLSAERQVRRDHARRRGSSRAVRAAGGARALSSEVVFLNCRRRAQPVLRTPEGNRRECTGSSRGRSLRVLRRANDPPISTSTPESVIPSWDLHIRIISNAGDACPSPSSSGGLFILDGVSRLKTVITDMQNPPSATIPNNVVYGGPHASPHGAKWVRSIQSPNGPSLVCQNIQSDREGILF
ncbi:hypothetical protein B0H13DRAFT_1868581 [Mycena leptocephala]|nr:hypothetical protein B0H13DRAFT_1868581 [Mycena leptocephala]